MDASPRAGELQRAVIPGTPAVVDPWADGAPMVPPAIGDLDGDGWPDLVGGQTRACIARCSYGAGSETWQDAVVAVWPGGPGGFPATPTFEAWAPGRYRELRPVAFAGDTDGDGTPEVVLADPLASHGAQEEGKLWLAPGTPAGLAPPTWSVEGGIPDLHLGDSVQALGDANGDGYDDLFVGLPASSWNNDGRAAVFYGGPTGFGAVPDWVSVVLGYDAGIALASGDLDGDGLTDLFVGAPFAPTGVGDGEVYGFRGRPGGFARSPDWTLSHPGNAVVLGFGTALQVLPDLDGDGYDELAVSSPTYRVGQSMNGRVEVFRGGPTGPANVASWTLLGPEPNDGLGSGLASGDLDGDGLTDLLMTVNRQWETAGGSADGAGGALVALGVPGGLSTTPAYVLRGAHGSLCGTGGAYLQVADVNGDGRDDVVLTCRTRPDAQVGDIGSIEISYGGSDTDTDGVTDGLDCDPSDPAIHPGADEIGYDGIDQGCDGGDDFDLDADGAQAVPWGPDEDDDDPYTVVILSMTVTGSCVGALDFAIDDVTPGGTVEVYAGRTAGGETHLSAPHPCEDAYHGLDLLDPMLLGSAVADGSGHAVLAGVPAAPTACTQLVQALDRSTCARSIRQPTPP